MALALYSGTVEVFRIVNNFWVVVSAKNKYIVVNTKTYPVDFQHTLQQQTLHTADHTASRSVFCFSKVPECAT